LGNLFAKCVTCVLDKSGKIVAEAVYDRIWAREDGTWYVQKDRKEGIIGKDGNFIVSLGNKYRQSEGLFIMEKEVSKGVWKYGFADANDNWIIEPVYNNAELFHEGLAWVLENENGILKDKFIDKTGKVVLDIEKLGYRLGATYFSDGLCLVQQNSTKKFGFIDKTGKLVIPAVYDILDDNPFSFDAPDSFHDGRAIVKKDGKLGMIDTKGDIVVPIIYDNLSYFRKWNLGNIIYDGYVTALKDGKYGIVDYRTGSVTVPLIYDDIDDSGLSEDGLIAVKQNGKYGILQVFTGAGDFEYEVSGGTATITKYIGNKTAVKIPDSIGGAKVTVIGEGAFYANKAVTSVIIPDSVTSIIGGVFTYCSNLTSVIIGSGVTSIGSAAFSYCESLTSVIIPDNVIYIRAGAFFGCTSLTSVTIPKSVLEISDDVFSNCPKLKMTCYENSAAHKYAVENNISFVLE
jgi:hypothetical protein